MAGLPPLAEVRDLADWVGETIAPADRRAGAVLRAASALVRAEAGRTWVGDDGELVDESLIPDEVISITTQVAGRAWSNPDGYSSERIGDYSYSRGSDHESGVYLTSAERAQLSRLRPSGAGRIGTIATTRGDRGPIDRYAPVVNANWRIPW